ncbi:hypothetical protein GCM10009077_28500 [Roseibium denhamense]
MADNSRRKPRPNRPCRNKAGRRLLRPRRTSLRHRGRDARPIRGKGRDRARIPMPQPRRATNMASSRRLTFIARHLRHNPAPASHLRPRRSLDRRGSRSPDRGNLPARPISTRSVLPTGTRSPVPPRRYCFFWAGCI